MMWGLLDLDAWTMGRAVAEACEIKCSRASGEPTKQQAIARIVREKPRRGQIIVCAIDKNL